MQFIPILSTVISFSFAAAVLVRWRVKRPPHLLLWGVGLILYGLGTFSEVLLALFYSPQILKLWYLSGAMLVAAWLGQGTVYLLVRRRRAADGLMVLLGLVSLASLILIAAAPVQSGLQFDITRPISGQYKEILVRSSPIILLTILLNLYGTIALVGGAVYSAFLFWRKSVLANRMLGNILIAAGALMPAMAGSLLKAGLVDFLYLSEFLGVVLMYSGFLLATASRPAERSIAAPAD